MVHLDTYITYTSIESFKYSLIPSQLIAVSNPVQEQSGNLLRAQLSNSRIVREGDWPDK